MSRIMGGWLSALSRMFVIEGGRVDTKELRDSDGVSLVLDVGRIAAGQFLAATTRKIEQLNINDVGTVIQVGSLPRTFTIRGFDVTVNNPANVAELCLFVALWGGIGGVNNDDYLLWRWVNGGTTIPNLAQGNIGIGRPSGPYVHYLVPSIDRIQGAGGQQFVYQDSQNQLGRTGMFDIALFAQAQPAVQFDIAASIYFYFHRDPEPGPGQGTISLAPPPGL